VAKQKEAGIDVVSDGEMEQGPASAPT